MPGLLKNIEITREYVRRFPKSGHAALARKLYSDNPAVYPTLNAALCSIRAARGKQGDKSRETVGSADFETHTRHHTGLPPGKKQLPNWKIAQYDQPGSWLVMGDIHIPWHDQSAVAALLDEARKRKVVGILLNGDIVDCHDASDHEKDPRVKVFKEEIETVREFQKSLRKMFPKAKIVWKIGNHEERYARYMQRKAPELLDIDDFQWESMCRTKDHGVTVVKDCQPIGLGKLLIIHGHEYRFAISNPVSAARGMFLRGGVSSVCNHFHRTSQFSKTDLRGHTVSTWSIGCLCDMRPKWLPINDWNLGAAFVDVGKGGTYDVENLRIIDGRIYQ